MKKVLSLLLSLTMLLSIVSVVDFSAYADTLTTGKCGKNVTYSLDTSTGVLTINGEGDMENYNYNNYKNNPFYKKSNIKTVIIKNGVTSIGDYTFRDCTSLKSVTIPDSVISIGDYAFYNCSSLTSVTIPNSVTSIGSCAFDGCTSLTSVTIPDSVTSIGYYAFCNCTSLKSIEVLDNNKNYASVDGVLFNKNKTELITYPLGKTDSEYAIPNSVTSIGEDAFRSCTSLTSITIPDSVTSIGDSAFYYCTSLTSVTIPDSVTSIGYETFYNCTSLTSITIPDSVTSIGGSAFYGCTSLTSIKVSGNNKNYSSVDGVLFNKDKSELIVYPAGKTDSEYAIPNSVTSIGSCAFDGCTSLTSVTIPNSVTSIGDWAFDGCRSLTSITIPDSVTSIDDRAFYYCTSLTSITIPDSVTSIGYYAFDGCTSLTNVNYSGTKSQWKTITIVSYNDELENAIIICTDGIIGNENTVTIDNLKYKIYDDTASLVGYTDSPENLVISKNISYEGYTLNVTSIGGSSFYGCTSLTSITIPNSVTSIGYYAFYNCTSLTSVTIPNSVTSIGEDAFRSCTSLTSITIPDSVTSIGDSAFYGCTSLTSVTIPNSVTSIGNYLFGCCTSLTSVTIPNSVTSIGTRAFKDCKNLKNIIVFNPNCKFGSYIVNKSVKIYGFANSTANKYANSNGNEFIEIYCNDYSMEHNYESKILTQPTCTKKGVTRYTCSRCGYSYDEENIEALGDLGHNYVSKVIKQPTCTAKGTTRYTCSYCGDYYDKEDIAALGHNYVSKVLTQPTCTEKGTTRYTCTRCNNYYDKKDIEELGHDTKIVERVEPTLTEDGFYRVECQRDGCGYSSSHPLEQLTLGYNQKVKSNGSDTYKIEMDKSGYLIFDFEGESQEWNINIYDEDYNKIDTLKPVYKEFYKKSYLQISLGSSVPNKNQMVALFAGKYYVEIDRLNNATNDNFSGNYTFSIDYSPANETIKETKNDFYYDAPTAKNIELNKTYNGFLGAKYACYNYVGNPILTTDERDAYKIEIPKGSGLSQFSVTLSSKAFAPLGSDCTLILYNSEFEPYDGFKPLTVSLNSTLNETIYLYEGTYYIAVVNDNSPIEYTFTTTFKPQGTFTCVEHKGKLVNTVNPTCTQNGYNSYVCQICGAQYNEIIPAYGHNAVIDYEVAPTLVSSGLTRGSHCSICGAVITPQTVIPQISAPTQPTTTPTTSAKAVSKPKSAKIKKVKAAKKAVSVEWKKVSGVKGYQIQVATDKKFKKNKKTATVKKQKTTKVTIKKLKAKKKYYVRIRTYKTVKGKKVYSSWSKVKTVKTK